MFPFDLHTIRAIQSELVDKVIYGPDPIDERWGWAIICSGTILYESGFVYDERLQAKQECNVFVLKAWDISVETI